MSSPIAALQKIPKTDELHSVHGAIPADEPLQPPPCNPGAHISSIAQYRELYGKSIADPKAFWSELALREFAFKFEGDSQTFKHVLRYNFNMDNAPVAIRWFEGSLTNLSFNCLDRHVAAGRGDQVCFIWEGNDEEDVALKLSYAEVLAKVCKMANVLKSMGVEKGDFVALYLPMIVELPIAMLACARIGAVHSVMFGGFAAESLCSRIADSRPKVVVTADGCLRGKKLVPLKATSDESLELSSAAGYTVPHQLVVRRAGNSVTMLPGRDVWWHDLADAASSECAVEWVPAEHPLFILYTSGSTGKPKAVLHTSAGYMVYAATTFKYSFDYQPGDVFWCTADCGWITGHSYVTYGPLLNGATQIIFEGIPTHPTPYRFWDLVQKHRVTQFYTAPTVIRSLMSVGSDAEVSARDLSSLRVLGSVGEPINPDPWRWYHSVVGGGRCPIVDTWWQTETGGHMITPMPFATPLAAGSATLPFFGVQPVVLDADGNELEGVCSGILAIKSPWPGMMRTLMGDHDRFESTYFSTFKGYYFTGDGCRRDKHGYYWWPALSPRMLRLTGRVDDVINVSGHRIGTAEVENALTLHDACTEAATVGYPHAIKGEGLYCYVCTKPGVALTAELKNELKEMCRREIGAFATPDVIHFATTGLPKTRSGKIMRRILRKIAAGDTSELGDTSTLTDPSVVDMLISTKNK